METEWYIGTMRDADSLADLAVPISRGEHEALRDAERVIREALGGMLFRLVFVNMERCEISRPRCSNG
jgi:hypothetical protein